MLHTSTKLDLNKPSLTTKMLTSAIPFVMVAMAPAAYAQTATNTATVAVPAHANDPTAGNNSATDSDIVTSPVVSPPAFPSGPGLGASVCNATPATSAYQNYGIRWDHTDNSGTSGDALIVNTDTFASATAATYSGISAQVNGYDVKINADTIPAAYNPNSYMEYQFTTEDFTNLSELRGIALTLYGEDDPTHYVATGNYRFAVAIDDDVGFGSPDILINDITLDGVDTSGATVATSAADNGKYLRSFAHWDANGTTVNLLPDTTYSVRVYPYNVTENGQDSIQAYSNLVLWDDFMLKSISCDFTITAEAEAYPTMATSGGVTTSVLASDELNGAAVDPSDITLTVDDILDAEGNPSTVLSLDPDTGLISVATNTPPGIYTVEYSICEDAIPNNCATFVESVTIEASPSIEMTKVADSQGPHKAGDIVTYTYTVKNDGDQIIRDIAISDTHNGSDPAPVPGNETLLIDVAPMNDSTDVAQDGSWDVLSPGDTLTFTGTYTVTADDVENL